MSATAYARAGFADPQSGPARAGSGMPGFFHFSLQWVHAVPGRISGLNLSNYINRVDEHAGESPSPKRGVAGALESSASRAVAYITRRAGERERGELGAHVLLTRGLPVASGAALARLLDARERKKDRTYRCYGGRLPRVAIHAVASFPYGITPAQAGTVLREFAQALSDRLLVPIEGQVHNKNGQPDHLHLVIGTRVVENGRLERKQRQLDAVSEKADGNGIDIGERVLGATVEWMRAEWARRMREVSGDHGIDHRSYARRDLALTPVTHVPRADIEYERRRGRATWRDRRRLELAARHQAVAAGQADVAANLLLQGASPARSAVNSDGIGRRSAAMPDASAAPARDREGATSRAAGDLIGLLGLDLPGEGLEVLLPQRGSHVQGDALRHRAEALLEASMPPAIVMTSGTDGRSAAERLVDLLGVDVLPEALDLLLRRQMPDTAASDRATAPSRHVPYPSKLARHGGALIGTQSPTSGRSGDIVDGPAGELAGLLGLDMPVERLEGLLWPRATHAREAALRHRAEALLEASMPPAGVSNGASNCRSAAERLVDLLGLDVLPETLDLLLRRQKPETAASDRATALSRHGPDPSKLARHDGALISMQSPTSGRSGDIVDDPAGEFAGLLGLNLIVEGLEALLRPHAAQEQEAALRRRAEALLDASMPPASVTTGATDGPSAAERLAELLGVNMTPEALDLLLRRRGTDTTAGDKVTAPSRRGPHPSKMARHDGTLIGTQVSPSKRSGAIVDGAASKIAELLGLDLPGEGLDQLLRRTAVDRQQETEGGQVNALPRRDAADCAISRPTGTKAKPEAPIRSVPSQRPPIGAIAHAAENIRSDAVASKSMLPEQAKAGVVPASPLVRRPGRSLSRETAPSVAFDPQPVIAPRIIDEGPLVATLSAGRRADTSPVPLCRNAPVGPMEADQHSLGMRDHAGQAPHPNLGHAIAMFTNLRRARRLSASRVEELARTVGLSRPAFEAAADASKPPSAPTQVDAAEAGTLPPQLSGLLRQWTAEDNAARADRRGRAKEGAPRAAGGPSHAATPRDVAGRTGTTVARPMQSSAGSVTPPGSARGADASLQDSLQPVPAPGPGLTTPRRPDHAAATQPPSAAALSIWVKPDVLDHTLVAAFAADTRSAAVRQGKIPPSGAALERGIAVRLRATGRNRTEVAAVLRVGAVNAACRTGEQEVGRDEDFLSPDRIARALDHAFAQRTSEWLRTRPSYSARMRAVEMQTEAGLYRRLRREALDELRRDLDAVWTKRRMLADEAARRHARRLAFLTDLRWRLRRPQRRRRLALMILAALVEVGVLALIARQKHLAASERSAINEAASRASAELKSRRQEWRAHVKTRHAPVSARVREEAAQDGAHQTPQRHVQAPAPSRPPDDTVGDEERLRVAAAVALVAAARGLWSTPLVDQLAQLIGTDRTGLWSLACAACRRHHGHARPGSLKDVAVAAHWEAALQGVSLLAWTEMLGCMKQLAGQRGQRGRAGKDGADRAPER